RPGGLKRDRTQARTPQIRPALRVHDSPSRDGEDECAGASHNWPVPLETDPFGSVDAINKDRERGKVERQRRLPRHGAKHLERLGDATSSNVGKKLLKRGGAASDVDHSGQSLSAVLTQADFPTESPSIPFPEQAAP